jgi:uncharacterized cupin superfamily protein
MPPGPRLVEWTHHAAAKATRQGLTTADVETTLLEHHQARKRNSGTAGWRVTVGRLVIVYDWPLAEDPLRARVVSVWRRAG